MKTSTLQQSSGGSRRWILRAAIAALGAVVMAPASVLPASAAPVTLNIVDVAGNLALTQDAIDAYVKKNPDKISKVTYTKAPAPELPSKLKAMQGAGRSDIDLVLTGTDFLAAGIEQGHYAGIVGLRQTAENARHLVAETEAQGEHADSFAQPGVDLVGVD